MDAGKNQNNVQVLESNTTPIVEGLRIKTE